MLNSERKELEISIDILFYYTSYYVQFQLLQAPVLLVIMITVFDLLLTNAKCSLLVVILHTNYL